VLTHRRIPDGDVVDHDDSVKRVLSRSGTWIAWLAVVVLLAAFGALVVLAAEHPPVSGQAQQGAGAPGWPAPALGTRRDPAVAAEGAGPRHSPPTCQKGHAMEPPVAHPAWCRRADCADTGTHESATVQASLPGDLLGIDATLVQLAVGGAPRLVRLAVTDDDETTTYLVTADQARCLHRALGALVST